MGAGGSKNE
jgi:hypothetical protein